MSRYVEIGPLKEQVDYQPDDFFEHNAELRFDELLGGSSYVGSDSQFSDFSGLEQQAREMIETRHGNEPFSEETGRTDTLRATGDAALPLVFPVNDVTTVEREIVESNGVSWDTIDAERYYHTEYRLVLRNSRRRRRTATATGRRANPLRNTTDRPEWREIADRIRVTYDRGFASIPGDLQRVTVRLVNQMLRNLRTEQTVAAMEPDQLEALNSATAVVTDDLADEIDALTHLGGTAQSV